ncbi:hypothetical protein WSS_A34792 [Rhodococcus opacus M213]|uniref:Uncharacterized protein n=1 Tax=Rhodococcus opacus M213 TaxID=1129896 RepID=K8X8Z4_RHOOP|nr:hypothetical protein WSS_A34792 [Rhodococcus opacus M213]
MEAILHVNRTGCSWRQLPHDFLPWQTVFGYFQRWNESGVTDRIHDALRAKLRDLSGRDPMASAGMVDAQAVKGADKTLSGVIDFGDMFAGDPAWELAAAWLLLPAGATTRFFEGYAHVEEATIRRARGLAALKSLFLILMGQNGDRGLPGGKPTWGPAGRAALDRVLTSSLGWPSPP